MTFIFDAPDEVALPVLYGLIDEIGELFNDVFSADVRQQLEAGKTAEEIGKERIKSMLKMMCVEKPKEAGALFRKFWVCQDGEKAPNTMTTFLTVIGRKESMDFFTSAMQLAR